MSAFQVRLGAAAKTAARGPGRGRIGAWLSRCALLLLAALAASVAQADFLDAFIDPQDGQFDVSDWLLDRKGFLPVPIIITEPAVGYGGGMAAVFFRESMRESAGRKGPSGESVPPDILGIAAAGTSNGTKFGGLGGIASFAEDRWRYRGGAAKVSANLDFYGIGGALGGDEHKIGYNLDGWGGMQQLLYRLGNSDTWITGRWVYLDTKSSLKTDDPDNALLPDFAFAKRSSGIGPTIEYDSRDNIFTPNRGWTGSLDFTFYDRAWGSDNEFQSYRAHVFAYVPFADTFVLGLRADGRAARGDVPFYMYPFVDLRGVPAGRLQDENTGVIETELRWNLTPRWALVGFVGAARAWGRHEGFSDVPTAVGKGGGFRYKIASRLGLYVGVDYANSQYDHAIYLQVGNGWR